MRKHILSAMGLLLVALLAWASGDPWKEKPYQQWDEKEVRRILTDSPWAKLVRVNASWKGGSSEEQEGGEGSAARPQGGTSRGYPSGGGAQSGAGGSGESQAPQAAFLVRWNSSRAVRGAAYRGAILSGQMKQAEAEKLMAQPVADYEVLVTGPDMTPFVGADEGALKAAAYLQTKRSKTKVAASSVKVQRATDGKGVSAVLFSFPKKAENGEAEIAPDEKSVEFVCTLRNLSLRSSFEPQKMADKQGQDL